MEPVQAARGAPLGREHDLSPADGSSAAAAPRAAFWVAAAGHALCHGSKVALPLITLTVAAEAFGVGLEAMGWAISAYVLGMGLASVPAGLAGDRWGTIPVLIGYGLLSGVAALACATAGSFGTFLAAHAVLGLAAGMFHPAGLGLLTLALPEREQGRAMGLFGVAGSVGMVAMPPLVGSSWGWRAAFFALGMGGFALALASWLLARRGHLHDSRPRGARAAAAPREAPARASNAPLILLLVAMSGNAFLNSGWETVFPETVAATGLLVLDDTAILVGILLVGGVGQYVGGMLSRDQFTAPRFAVILVLQVLILLGTAAALDRGLLPFAFLGSFAFLNYMTQPMENRLLAGLTSTRRRATAFALKFLCALVIASPAPRLMAGLVEGSAETAPGYRLLSALGLIGVFAAYFLLRQQRLARRAGRG